MKKEYEAPSVDVIVIDDDIICTSCPNGTPNATCPLDTP